MIERVLDAIGTIDDELLERVSAARWAAENAPPLRTKKSEKRRLLLWAAGACACLLALTAVLRWLPHSREGRQPEGSNIVAWSSGESGSSAERVVQNTEGESRLDLPTDPTAPGARETEVQTRTEAAETKTTPANPSENETQAELTEPASRRNGEAISAGITDAETVPEQSENAGNDPSGPLESKPGGTEEPSQVRVIWAEDAVTMQPVSYVSLNGKNCNFRLIEAMNAKENENGIFAIAVLPPMPILVNPDYLYKGKTIEEYADAVKEIPRYLNQLSLLLEKGDELKYGAALYEEGAPDGTKWTKQYYDSVVEQIGQELLDRYLADGEFLREKLEADVAELEAVKAERCAEAEEQYDEACAACRREMVLAAIPEGIDYELREDGCGVLFMTEEEFRELVFPGIGEWCFDLAHQGGESGERNAAQPM